MFIYSHNENSEGAKSLATELGIKRIRHEGSKFKGSKDKTVINWGSHTLPQEIAKCNVLNPTNMVEVNADKLKFFRRMKEAQDGPRTPDFTASKDVVREWIVEGRTVLARTLLNSSSGKGIHILEFNQPNSFVDAPLYTTYVKKKDEYRVHFVGNNIVDFARKAVRPGSNPDTINWKIRNLMNGFIYVRSDVDLPEDVRVQALKAIASIGLDFGAIDIIYNEQSQKAYVLEVNTAPGLQGSTITAYANAIRSHVNEG